MALDVAKVKLKWRDESKEQTTTQFYIEDLISLLTEWASMFSGGSAYDNVKTAMAAVSDCQTLGGSTTFPVDTAVGSAATVGSAQRESVLRIKVQDVSNGRFAFINIPGYKISMRTAGTDEASFASGAMATLKSAIETNCLSRDGNALVVVSGRFTGRND